LLSIVLVAIGLWIRLGILESPVFQKLLAEDRIEAAPVTEVFRLQAKQVFLSAFARMGEQAPFYIFTAFVFSYGVGTLKMSRDMLLVSVLVASCVSFVTIPLAGHLSDRFGRKRVYLAGTVATAVFSWIYFALLNTVMPFWVFIAIVVSLIPHDTMYGPQAALIAESFTGRLRYSGASIGYQLASIIAGGPAPLVATALFAAYHSWVPIAVYITACCIISLIAAAMMTDYTNLDISGEYDTPVPRG
jgi:MFS family permease